MSLYPEDPRFYLRSEYELRQLRNPAYSWRSFARDLKISPSMLSEFLKGRYGLSRAKALSVAKDIRLDEVHTEHFLNLLEAGFHRTPAQRDLARMRVRERMNGASPGLSRETLASIVDCTYFALLEVVGLDGGKIHHEGWTKPVRSCILKIKEAVQKLTELNLLRQEGEKLVPVEEVTITGDQLPAQEVQKLHTQVLGMAQSALVDLPANEREAVSVFGSLHSDDFEDLKKELNDSFLQLLNKYTSKRPPDAVFCFAWQGFPIYRKPTAPPPETQKKT